MTPRAAACSILALTMATSIAAAPRLQTDIDVPWTYNALQARKTEQIKLAKSAQVFYGFQFSNQVQRSGITFRPGIVDDCTRLQKATIYDHGCGLAAADVNGDGKLDLYFVNQLGGSELWLNSGDGKFQNATESAGVALKDKISVSAAFADADNDGDPDLFVTTVRTGNVLFENLGSGKFRDISKNAGVDYVGHSSAPLFFDFDNDGLLDIFVSNVGKYTIDEKGRGGYYAAVPKIAMGWGSTEPSARSLLYKNMGGLKFKEVALDMNLTAQEWSPDATFCDFNQDGFLDLYVLNMNGPNFYFENQGGKRFVEKTKQYFARSSSGSMSIKNFDFNQDGALDFFITDMHSDMSQLQVKLSNRNLRLDFEKAKSEGWCTADWTAEEKRLNGTNTFIFGNTLYVKNNDASFAEISAKANAETFWPWGPSVGDLNADGFDDAFITAGMGFPLRYSINSVLLNDGGKRFVDAEFLVNVEPRAEIEHEYFSLDCSGADKDTKFCYHKVGKLDVRGAASSRSSVVADFDGDGDMDIITSEFNDIPQVLISNLAEKRKINFVQMKLVGTGSNRDGLGATVRVKSGGRTLTQFNDGKSGYLSHSVMPLYFGLGEATKVDSIEVTWPSGAKQTVSSDIALNKQIEITEPKR